MPLIALKGGDFGTDVTATLAEDEMYLPDPAAEGRRVTVPLSDLLEVEAVAEDHSGRIGEAVRLGVKGAAALGPAGIAAGVLALRKPKQVTFSVRLRDGRGFLAAADAQTFADLRGARLTGRLSADPADNRAADEVIARYLAERAGPASGPVAPAAPPASGRQGAGVPPSADDAARPVFGRRRR